MLKRENSYKKQLSFKCVIKPIYWPPKWHFPFTFLSLFHSVCMCVCVCVLENVVVRCPVCYIRVQLYMENVTPQKQGRRHKTFMESRPIEKNTTNTLRLHSIIIRCRQFSQFIHNNNNNKMRLNGFHGISCIYVVMCAMPV